MTNPTPTVSLLLLPSLPDKRAQHLVAGGDRASIFPGARHPFFPGCCPAAFAAARLASASLYNRSFSHRIVVSPLPLPASVSPRFRSICRSHICEAANAPPTRRQPPPTRRRRSRHQPPPPPRPLRLCTPLIEQAFSGEADHARGSSTRRGSKDWRTSPHFAPTAISDARFGMRGWRCATARRTCRRSSRPPAPPTASDAATGWSRCSPARRLACPSLPPSLPCASPVCLCCVPVLHAPPVCPRRLRCLPSHAYRPRPRPLSPSLPPLPPSPSSFTRSRHGNCRDGCDSMNGPAFCPLLPPAGDVPLVQGAPSRRRSTSRPSASGSSRISSRSRSSSSSSSGAEGADAAAHAADSDAGHWMAGRGHEVEMGGGREPAAYN